MEERKVEITDILHVLKLKFFRALLRKMEDEKNRIGAKIKSQPEKNREGGSGIT